MATIAIKTIRQRIETAIAAVSGWHRSRSPGDIFGLDPNTYAHQAFSIDIPSTTDLGTSRQNTAALSSGPGSPQRFGYNGPIESGQNHRSILWILRWMVRRNWLRR